MKMPIALDLGGVLLTDGTKTAFAELQQRFDIPAVSAENLWKSRLRIPAELGEIGENTIWQQLASLAPSAVDADDLATAFLSEFQPIEYGITVLRKMFAKGHRVGLATNHLSSWINRWRACYDWFELLDPVCCSSEWHDRKPCGSFFKRVTMTFNGVAPILVDDDEENVEGARRSGLLSLRAEGDWLVGLERLCA